MKHESPSEESSMEEILASIRQIISSETKDSRKPMTKPRHDEDILDLTDILPDEKATQKPRQPKVPPKRETVRESRLEKGPVDKIDIYNLLDEAKVSSLRSPSSSPPPRQQNGESVESLVRELIRPQIKTWLESNLPSLVRNVIHEEVENIIRQIGRGKK